MTTKRSRILVVDDQFGSRDGMEMFLQAQGYITDCADSGKHALMKIGERLPDLVILDVSMPGIDGYEVAHLLKSNSVTADIPIIMVTAHTSRDARLAGLKKGVEDFMTKPVDTAELALKIRNLLRLRANAQAAG